MNDFLQNIRQRLSAGASATVKFYRANTTLLLSVFTIMSFLLIVWARLGFTLDFGRSSAAVHEPSVLTVVCGATQNVLTWTLPAGHDSNSIIRNDNGADGVWVCGGPGNIAPCTNLNVATYTDTNIQAGHTYNYRHKAWADVASNTVTCAPATSPVSSPSSSPDPNAPPAGTIVGSCTGGSTPRITLRYSKLPPPGTTDPVNSNGMNKGTTPPGGTRTVEQLATFNPVDKGQYWEWTDTNVLTNYTYDYRAKYHPNVGTNTVTIVATPANCGAPAATPTPTVDIQCGDDDPDTGAQGPCKVNAGTAVRLSWSSTNATTCQATGAWASPGPRPTTASAQQETPQPPQQVYTITCTGAGGTATDSVTVVSSAVATTSPPACTRQGQIPTGSRCCDGLVEESVRGLGNDIGTPPYCVPPGCYYQQVQCVTTPCDPVLVCPTASPTATPETLSCAPVSQTVGIEQEARFDAAGGTGSYRWSVADSNGGVDLDARGDSAVARAAVAGTYIIQLTSGDQAASCEVRVVQGATPPPAPAAALTVILTGKNASTNGVESDSTAVRTGQQVELRVRVANRFNSGNQTNITLRVPLPAGLSYVSGSTTIGGAKVAADTVTTGGLALGGLGAGQDVLVTFRATVLAPQFPVGSTQVQPVAQAQSASGEASDPTTVVVTRPTSGATGTPQTGPGEALLAAFLVSAIMTLLYVSYTHTSSYKRREIGSIAEQRDPLDFRS